METRVVCILLLSIATTVSAQEPLARMTLADAVAEALRTHPDIAAARRRHEAAAQRPVQERALPDPMVSAGYAAAGNPLPGAGLGKEPTASIGVMVSQEIPFPGKRNARAAVASREADAEFEQIDAARLGVASRVKQAYYALASARAATAVLERNRELLTTLVRVSEHRYAVGRAAQQDVIKAQTQLSVLELQQRKLAGIARTREGELNALLSRPAATTIGIVDDLSLPLFAESIDALISSAAVNAPMLKREQVMIDRSRLAVDLARLDYKPDFAVSGGYAYAGEMPAMYEFRVDVTIPLQRSRRAAAVAEQRSLASAAQLSFDTTRLSIRARLHEDFEMASTSSRLALLYRDTVLPQARLALESSLASYQTGAIDFLSVLTNFTMVLEYEMAYFEELAEFHRAVSRLEEMTGTPIAH
jgi:cobalt-zinc-cadmium efflux system outer membrane protein